ncbi:MAG: helix-turn-helix domain-containing protein [Rikenellaceae bacterium]
MLTSPQYISHRLANLDELKSQFTQPQQIQAGGFLLCLSGEGDVVVDNKQFHLRPNDLIVAFPYSVVQALSSSDDFDCILIEVKIDFFAKIQVSNKSHYFTTIKEHPSIQLSREEAKRIISLSEMFLEGYDLPLSHPFRDEINESVLKVVLYEIAAIYDRRSPNVEQKRSRDDTIFHSFIVCLFQNYRRERTLEYYAQRQQITAGHLSKVVRRVSGRGASEWIADCVVSNIRFMLEDHTIPISRIAEEFYFPNNSFFSQYFRRYVGVSPRAYRAGAEQRINVE